MKIAGGVFSFNTSLTIEAPVLIPKGTVFCAESALGFLSYLGKDVRLTNATVGRYCSISDNVIIGVPEHPLDRVTTHPLTYNWNLGPDDDDTCAFSPFEEYQRLLDKTALLPFKDYPRTIIGHDVWIGRSVTIKPGVKIGDGAVIGAHAVVTKDIPPYTIVGGIPARTIRQRFDDKTIERFLALQWWLYDIAPLKKSVGYTNVQAFLDALERGLQGNTLPILRPETYLLENDNGLFRVKPANAN